jgi:hypothetical protein
MALHSASGARQFANARIATAPVITSVKPRAPTAVHNFYALPMNPRDTHRRVVDEVVALAVGL